MSVVNLSAQIPAWGAAGQLDGCVAVLPPLELGGALLAHLPLCPCSR